MDPFILKIVLLFIIGSAWITFTTLLAEKRGTRIAGIIAGLPSAILLTVLFIALNQGLDTAIKSTTTIPISMGASAMFVSVYILVSRKDFLLSLILALLCWFIIAAAIYFINPNFIFSILGWMILLGAAYFLIKSSSDSQMPKKASYSLSQIFLRAIFSGSLIVFAVLIAKIGGPTLGGIFAAFPMMTLPSIIITYLAQGRTFSTAFMKSMMLSSSLNVVAFVIGIRYFLMPFGLFFGTILSLFLSLLVTWIFFFIPKNSQ